MGGLYLNFGSETDEGSANPGNPGNPGARRGYCFNPSAVVMCITHPLPWDTRVQVVLSDIS